VTSISRCCNETIRVGGEGTTHWYICNKCNKPCDIREKPSLQEQLEEAFAKDSYEQYWSMPWDDLDSFHKQQQLKAARRQLALLAAWRGEHGERVRLLVPCPPKDAPCPEFKCERYGMNCRKSEKILPLQEQGDTLICPSLDYCAKIDIVMERISFPPR